MSEKRKVQVSKPFTYDGKDYGEGTHPDMPEKAALYAERRRFGKILGAKPAEASAEVATELPADFEPLSPEETMRRFTSGDSSEIVFQSLKFNQKTLIAVPPPKNSTHEPGKTNEKETGEGDQTSKKTAGENENANVKASGKPEDDPAAKTSAPTPTPTPSGQTGLPEDFPMKHVLEKPNELSETGFTSVADVQKHTVEELTEINGIAGKTAVRILAYGK